MMRRGSIEARRIAAITTMVGATLASAVASGQVPPQGAAPPAAARPVIPQAPTAVRSGVPERRVDRSVAKSTRDGNQALLADRPDDALQLYTNAQVEAPDVPELEYDRGLAALLKGDAAEADKAFALSQELARPVPPASGAPRSAKKAPVTPPELIEDSRFNQAHAAWMQDQVPQAIQGWASVIAKDQDAGDARRNLELALRLVKQQEQQQQQQQQNQDDQKKDDQDQKDQQQQQQQQQDQDKDQQKKPDQGEGQQQQPQSPDQQQPPKPDQGQQQGQPQGAPGELTKEQAEELLAALEADEKQAMKEQQGKQARQIRPAGGKDW